MNRLRRDGLLLALVLATLPADSLPARAADRRTSSPSKDQVTTTGVQEGIVAFRRDHAASAPDRLPAGAPTSLATNREQGLTGPMLASIGRFDVSGMHNPNRGYSFSIPPSAGKFSSLEPHAEYRISGSKTSLVDKSTTLYLGGVVAPGQRAGSSMQSLIGTKRPLHESIDFELLKSDEEDALDRKQVSSGGVRFDGVNVGDAWTLFDRLAAHRQRSEASEAPVVDAGFYDYRPPEHYHWGGLLAQSLFFNVIENGFRAASDDQIRTLLANKPFWHDYAASIRKFNMRRWNDGDDFLVNYTGHPMQGAVSGFIEIQNDPKGRELEISANHEYWESRFKAFLWAAAYSTHSEISPIGEAGIGNEGGWTYPIHCKTRCTEPGTYKHYTNNTGWVDFIVTPTAGILWLLAEDTLDRYISDRIQGDDRARIVPKIIRGALNPSRTMANAVRFKAPWYRDSQQNADIERSQGVHFLPSDEDVAAAEEFRKVSIAPYFRSMPFGTPSRSCTLCIQNPGVGVALDYALARWVSASIAIENQSNSVVRSTTATGSAVSVGFGLRLMYETPHNTISFAVRPGFMFTQVTPPSHSEGTGAGDPKQLQTVENGFITLALSNDIKITPLLSMRFSIGDTIVRTGIPDGQTGIGSPPYLSWLSKREYTNKSTWSSALGPVLRF